MKLGDTWPCATWGDPAAPTVLMLHGFLGAGADWKPIAESLSDDHHVICPDLPGHGSNTLSESVPFVRVTQGLAAFMESRDIQHTALVGYSLGGRLALQFAITHPERITRLVLESASPGIDDEHVRNSRYTHDDALARELEALPDDAVFRDWLRQWYAAPLWQTLHREPHLVESLIDARASAHPAGLAHALRSLSVGHQPSLWHQLDSLTCPVLLIAGGQDHKYMEIAERMTEINPAFARVPFDACGHNVHLESPAAYTTVLKSFLSV